jgi:hypothetical protein
VATNSQRQLRQGDPDAKVLYFTGFSDRLFADRNMLWENDAFIEKPVKVERLREAVSLLLFGHTQRVSSEDLRHDGSVGRGVAGSSSTFGDERERVFSVLISSSAYAKASVSHFRTCQARCSTSLPGTQG